jgi:hypothetical protein
MRRIYTDRAGAFFATDLRGFTRIGQKRLFVTDLRGFTWIEQTVFVCHELRGLRGLRRGKRVGALQESACAAPAEPRWPETNPRHPRQSVAKKALALSV